MDDMRRNLDKFVRLRREYEDKVHKEHSKERLNQSVATKIRTTMIGALAAMEEAFGEIWGQGKPFAELSPTERENYQIKEAMRKKIFDLGNKKIRNFNTEIDQYEVDWDKFNVELCKENFYTNFRKRDD